MNDTEPSRRSKFTAMQIAVSVLVLTLGLASAKALSQVDEDLRIMYMEYTLAAAEISHISGDIIRFRNTILQALEAPTRQRFEELTQNLPVHRARIQHAIDRYAAASLRISRSGRSEPEDVKAVRDSLEAYFAAASKTINMLTQLWIAKSPAEAARLRSQAEVHAADNAGPKLIQVSLALDRLLDTVADVAKDMRDEGTITIRKTSLALTIGSLILALLNLFVRAPAGSAATESAARGIGGQESLLGTPSERRFK